MTDEGKVELDELEAEEHETEDTGEHPYECTCCGGDGSQDEWMAMYHPTHGFVGVKLKMEFHTKESLERAIRRALVDSGLFHEFDHTTAWTVLHETGCELDREGRCWCGPKVVPRCVYEMWSEKGEPEAPGTVN